MHAPDWQVVILVVASALLTVLVPIFTISGIDDLFVDVYHAARTLYRRLFIRRRYPRLSEEQLRSRHEQPVAIMIPAWNEAAVIRSMLENTISELEYSNYHIFLGTYPNDPETHREVEMVRERHQNVHRIVCPRNGPTNKADCLNWVTQGIQAFERESGVRFEIFVMQDAEDLIHPLSLKLFNYLVPRKDMVQLPVVPLEPPIFGFTAGHYLDEFAENHTKDLVVRESLAQSLPSAGVGCAFSRRALELASRARQNQLFSPDSLTEDYEFGLSMGGLGLKQVFVRYIVRRVVTRRSRLTGRLQKRTVREIVGVREHFPSTYSTAVRQKSRWVVGIALQGWQNLGWRRRGSRWSRYMLARDRKALITSPVNVAAYLLVPVFLWEQLAPRLWSEAYRYPPLVEQGSWLYYLILVNAVFLAIRLAHRMVFVWRLHGIQQAILSAPRAVWGNFINFGATARALYLFARHLATGQPISWDKTAHAFPSETELRTFRRPIGDLLLERRIVSVQQLEAALARQRQTRAPLGSILADQGIDQEMLVRALGSQLHLPVRLAPFEPAPDACGLVSPTLAADHIVLPLELSVRGHLVIASFDPLSQEDVDAIATAAGRPVDVCLAPRSELLSAFQRLYGAPAPAVSP